MSDASWSAWAVSRPSTDLLHLDSAAVGRSSRATLEAVAEHARAEAELGGYVAEERAQPRLESLRRDVGELLGTDVEGVAFVESAMAALEALVHAWPLRPGARVAAPPSEWGPNLELLAAHDVAVEQLPVDGEGVIDLGALESLFAGDAPDVVIVDQLAAHRGLVQPADEVIALGLEHGVPVWLDAAQAVGHVPVARGADAVFATSRKWLGGPRGIGMLAVAERHHPHLRVRRPGKHPDLSPLRLLESEEAHVAGRVGLGVAVGEYLSLGPAAVAERLQETGSRVREMARTLEGWEVVHPEAPASATTALRSTAGHDVQRIQRRLLHEHRILTSVCLRWRAPREMVADEGPWLRLSPHVDLRGEDLDRLAEVLAGI